MFHNLFIYVKITKMKCIIHIKSKKFLVFVHEKTEQNII